MKVNIKSF